ncbi:MAG: hypothetical protein ACOY5H_01460 [Pseudomonadota bacterium]
MNELTSISGNRRELEQGFLEALFRGERDAALADRLKRGLSRSSLTVISGSGLPPDTSGTAIPHDRFLVH